MHKQLGLQNSGHESLCHRFLCATCHKVLPLTHARVCWLQRCGSGRHWGWQTHSSTKVGPPGCGNLVKECFYVVCIAAGMRVICATQLLFCSISVLLGLPASCWAVLQLVCKQMEVPFQESPHLRTWPCWLSLVVKTRAHTSVFVAPCRSATAPRLRLRRSARTPGHVPLRQHSSKGVQPGLLQAVLRRAGRGPRCSGCCVLHPPQSLTCRVSCAGSSRVVCTGCVGCK